MRIFRILLALALAGPVAAQIGGFDKAQLAKYTRLNPFERFDDGRPKIPQTLVDSLATASSEMLWGPLRRAGILRGCFVAERPHQQDHFNEQNAPEQSFEQHFTDIGRLL